MYTSNYARQSANPHAVAISCVVPHYIGNMRHLHDVAPTWELVHSYKNNEITIEDFKTHYLTLLHNRSVDPFRLLTSLPPETFFLCFEKPSDFCHRHLFAEWMQLSTGVIITEWKNEKEAHQEKECLLHTKTVETLIEF